jgi:hypothetical protein
MRPLFSVCKIVLALFEHCCWIETTAIAVNRGSVKISNKDQLILGPQNIGQHKVCERTLDGKTKTKNACKSSNSNG